MANNIPFQAMGKTTRINVTTAANTVAIISDGPANQLRIHNGTAAEVFVRLGITSTDDAAQDELPDASVNPAPLSQIRIWAS